MKIVLWYHAGSHRSSKSMNHVSQRSRDPVNADRSMQEMPRTGGGPALKQPTFDDCEAVDKNQELYNFEMEVKNIFITNSYNIQDNKRSQSSSKGLVEMDYSLYKH